MTEPSSENELVIEAGASEREYWRDLWRYRELLFFLARRDISVRYKQTAVGIAWVLLRPLVMMAAFALVFGRIANLPSHGAPYSLLVLSALLPWQFFAYAVSDGSASLVVNQNLISKVYFPRLVVPLSAIGAAGLDLAVSFLLLLVLMAWFGQAPTLRLLALPLFLLLALASALGLGIWLAALNVEYRDVKHVVPFLLQVGLFASPIGFASSVIPESWRIIFILNPLVGVIEGFRWALLGGQFPLRTDALLASVLIGTALLAGGLWFFRRTERSFADII